MKILTVNFLTCAVEACKSSPLSFPLHFRDAELAQQEMEFSPAFLRGILARVEWDALRTTAAELGFDWLPEAKPELPADESLEKGESEAGKAVEENATAMEVERAPATSGPNTQKLLKDLHTLLMETTVQEGKLICGNCQHEYPIKDGIANFLLPNHLV